MPIEVTTKSFESVVMEGSRSRPIVVDFWAPWCQPCVQLAPLLQDLEREAGGRWLLAKVNVDEEAQLGALFQVSGIPALKAIRDGRVISEMNGLATLDELRRWLAGFVEGEEADRVAAGREAEEAGDDARAEAEYRAALEVKPRFEPALVGLAAVLERQGRLEEASELIDLLEGPTAARIRLERAAAAGPSLEAARLAADERDDAESLYRLGLAEVAAGRLDEGLEALLESVRRDRKHADEAARKAIVEVFQLLGPESEKADDYRRRLAMLLF
jgi:putative thioredoxin